MQIGALLFCLVCGHIFFSTPLMPGTAGVLVSHLLSMREVPGAIPGWSALGFVLFCVFLRLGACVAGRSVAPASRRELVGGSSLHERKEEEDPKGTEGLKLKKASRGSQMLVAVLDILSVRQISCRGSVFSLFSVSSVLV